MSEKTPEARRSAALEKALAGEVRNVASAGAGGGAEGERVTRAVIYPGDCLTTLRSLPDGAARCCVTSPPYWGLRDYGVAGQLGLEPTPDAYVAGMVEVFREVRRVLSDDGTLWLNLGDSYAGGGGFSPTSPSNIAGAKQTTAKGSIKGAIKPQGVVKPKDLVGIPWRVAFALQADGWYLRSDIIWHKPNPMPESVKDRPTKAHEYVFLLSKRERYYYDAGAIAEPATFPDGPNSPESIASPFGQGFTRRAKSGNVARKMGAERGRPGSHLGGSIPWEGATRNARSVWSIATQPYPEAHFATFPEELPSRCIRAGSAPGDTVLDPFGGSGTTGAIAVGLGRSAILCELNPTYIDLARQRIGPMFCEVAA